MSRFLVIGGYGGFGSRIARRLAEAGYEVLVAGRSLQRATSFCRNHDGMRPLQIDASQDITEVLQRERPFAVVDAAGPFQHSDYAVPRAAIAAGSHYVDIADARRFVGGIGALDADARGAGVTVISGASSDPALTGAVARKLGEGMDNVRAIDVALSVSSRGAAGASVARAALSYAGRPLKLWRGGRWTTRYGWQEIRRHSYRVGNWPTLRRWVALVDVPSLDLLPARMRGRPAVSFRAGAQSPLDTLILWTLSWPVRWGWLRSIEPLHRTVQPVQRLRSHFDRGRSAMSVRLFGIADGRRLQRRWTILAEQDRGREIPCLAVPLILARMLKGEVEPGARDADGILTLEDFDEGFDRLGLHREMIERPLADPLYAQIMGERFALLPAAVADMHRALRDQGAFGRATVTRGNSVLARLVGAVMGFPKAGEHELHVHFEESEGRECWTRSFSGTSFRSSFSRRDALITERFGAVRFGFALDCLEGELRMRMQRWWICGVPMPLWLAPVSPAREWEEDGRFHFDVPISLPIAGPLIHYRGYLSPHGEQVAVPSAS